jgi:hypothetical protein
MNLCRISSPVLKSVYTMRHMSFAQEPELRLVPYGPDHPQTPALRRIAACFANKNELGAEMIFREVRQAGADDWAVWDIMIRGYLYLRKYPTAEALLAELQREGNMEKMNAAIFQRMIFYQINHLANHRRALVYLDKMERLGVIPTEKSLVLLTNAFFYKDRDYEMVIDLVDRFKRVTAPGFLVGPRLLSRVVQAYHNMNKHYEAIAAFADVLRSVDLYRNQPADGPRGNSASPLKNEEDMSDNDEINGEERDETNAGGRGGGGGRWGGYYDDSAASASEEKLHPEEYAAGVAMRSCIFSGELSQAVDIFRDIQLRNFRIHENCVHALAQIVFRSGGADALKKFFADLLDLKPGPTAMGYPSIISVLIAAKHHKAAEELYETYASRVDPVARPLMMARLMEAYAKDKSPEDMDRVLDICIKDFFELLDNGGVKQLKTARHLFFAVVGHLSKTGRIKQLEEFWIKATASREKGGYGLRPQAHNVATFCHGFASVGEFGKAFDYAAHFVDLARQGYFDLSYYFAVTFVAKVVLKSRVPLGNGYNAALGRWLDLGGSGRHVMSPTDKEDFVRDFSFWNQCWRDSQARENSLAKKAARIPLK